MNFNKNELLKQLRIILSILTGVNINLNNNHTDLIKLKYAQIYEIISKIHYLDIGVYSKKSIKYKVITEKTSLTRIINFIKRYPYATISLSIDKNSLSGVLFSGHPQKITLGKKDYNSNNDLYLLHDMRNIIIIFNNDLLLYNH